MDTGKSPARVWAEARWNYFHPVTPMPDGHGLWSDEVEMEAIQIACEAVVQHTLERIRRNQIILWPSNQN